MSDKQLWPDAYIPREDAEAVVAEWKQRAEASEHEAAALRASTEAAAVVYLRSEVDQLRDALAAATARAEAAENRLIAASDSMYDLIGELADATGRSRSEIEAAFLGEAHL